MSEVEPTEVPAFLKCWQSAEERDAPEKRQRWMGRFTFILAAIGSAIGLGNFWRFPYLTYKHGGAAFFFPWATCLFVMGIPFMIMELALGQKFQSGDIKVFRGIDRRLAGVGAISVYSSYVFSWYYNVIVAWSLVYVIVALGDPLPWATGNAGNAANGPESALRYPCGDTMSRAEMFYKIDVVRLVDPDNCTAWQDGDGTVFSWNALGACALTWFLIFLCVFKGVKSSSWIVWFTVPLPVLFVVIMIINGASLDGAGKGVERYFTGGGKETTAAEQWSDAAGQIFLGLSVCLGIMTSYGSYNAKNKPIILDSVIISISNCSFSFVAGFAVWTVVGYLEALGKLDESKTAGVWLAFITYPTAIDTMSAPNFWALLLGLTLFMLGIDSSFSAIEATSTVICDTAYAGKLPRMFIAFLLCLFGFLGSVPFCCNWGFTLFDVVDHYLCAYLLLIIGILQALGCGWFFDAAATMEKSEGHKKGIQILGWCYWTLLIIIGTATVFMDKVKIGFAVFTVLYLICVAAAFKVSGLPTKDFYQDVFMCGVRKIAYSCSQMGRPEHSKTTVMWWEPAFVLYWGLLIKFVNPCLLYFIALAILKTDLAKPYGDYSAGWQVIGWSIPAIGFLIFIISFFLSDEQEKIDYSEFELYTDDAGKDKKVAPTQEVEMVADNDGKPATGL